MTTLLFALLTAALASGCTAISPHSSIPAPATTVSELPAREIGRSVVVIGDLGVPLGTTVTIKGYSEGPGWGFFTVQEVNGKKHNAQILVDGAHNWKKGTEATLEGYEYGQIGLLQDLPHNLRIGDPILKEQRVHIRFHVLTDADRMMHNMNMEKPNN